MSGSFTASPGSQLRDGLAKFVREAERGQLKLVAPPEQQAVWTARGRGHFHLGAELFLQVQGLTHFYFPEGEVTLGAGQALVMPPKLLHDERVSASADGMPFSNLVIYADMSTVTCHLAHETQDGRPDILHLEALKHADATRIQGWLADATQGPSPDTDLHGLWPAQQRALVLAVLSAIWRLLDVPALTDLSGKEPALLLKLRRLIQNQLGNSDMTVRALAQQLGCTADYLSHLFSQTTGEHLRAFILRQRLRRAARLLADADAPVKEVAWCCGFGSSAYFIRCFGQQFGVTPKAYRAKAHAATLINPLVEV